jgi:hypothetical protein
MQCHVFMKRNVVGTLKLLIVFATNCFWVSLAYGQVAGASLSGTITDSSGGVVPNANILIRNAATNVTRDLTTDNAGFYAAQNRLPGTYEVTVTANGFSTIVQNRINLEVGAHQVLDLALSVDTSTQTIEITEETPAIELVSSAITEMVNSTAVRELPLNGRSWTDLATLQPGVDSIQTQP